MKAIFIILLVTSVTAFAQNNEGQLGCPNIIYPGGINIPLLPLMHWFKVSGATNYHLQISKSSNFDMLVVDIAGIQSTTYQITTMLEPLTYYYWRVRAGNNNGYTEWMCPDVIFITLP